MQGMGNTCCIGKLNHRELIFSLNSVGILLALANPYRHHDSAFMSVLEEVLDLLGVEASDWMDPDGPLQSIWFEIF
jgi:hypothetical protein